MSKVNKSIGIPLSNLEIENFLSSFSSTSYISYSSLPSYASLRDLFYDADFRVILLESDFNNVGHWIVILDRGADVYEYFDPLAFAPDDLQSFLNRGDMRKVTYFKDILQRTRKLNPKTYLEYYQRSPKTPSIQDIKASTCGKWVIQRVLSQKMSLLDFLDMFKRSAKANNISPDKYIMQTLNIPLLR